MLDWFVLFTPLLLLPILLLLAFVGCAAIAGLEERELAPQIPPGEVKFTYDPGLIAAGVQKIRWEFFTGGLKYQNGSLPDSFDPGPKVRADPLVDAMPPEINEQIGEMNVPHGDFGSPSDGKLKCEVKFWMDVNEAPSVREQTKLITDHDVKEYRFVVSDLNLI